MTLIKKYIYFIGLAYGSFLLGVDPTAQLFDGIKKNSLELVEKAISDGVDLSIKDLATDHTAIYEAVKNFLDKYNVSWSSKFKGLGIAFGGVLGSSIITGGMVGELIGQIMHLKTAYYDKSNYIKGTPELGKYAFDKLKNEYDANKKEASEGMEKRKSVNISEDTRVIPDPRVIATSSSEAQLVQKLPINPVMVTQYVESYEDIEKTKSTITSSLGITSLLLMATAGSFLGLWHLMDSAIKTFKDSAIAWKILSKIYSEMKKKDMLPDEESLGLIKDFIPQLDAEYKYSQSKIKRTR